MTAYSPTPTDQTESWTPAITWSGLTDATGARLPWGMYTLTLTQGSFIGKPERDTTWSGKIGGNQSLAIDTRDYYFAYLGDVTGTWSAAGEVTGTVTGDIVSPDYVGTFTGPLYGVNNGTGTGTWIASGVGTFEVAPSIAGGSWNQSALSDVSNGFSWGYFGLTEGQSGKLNLLALGQSNYSGVPVGSSLLMGGLSPFYGLDSATDRTRIQGLTAGIMQESGAMDGYLVALYARTGEAGLLYGPFAGNRYVMEEGPTTQGMFRVTSAAGITKQSMVVPSDFTHQQTGGYDYTPLYLRATSAQGNVLRTISTSTSSGNSLFGNGGPHPMVALFPGVSTTRSMM